MPDIRKKTRHTKHFYHNTINQINIIRRKNHRKYPLHSHDFEEIILVIGGNGIHFHNNQYDVLLPGACLYIKPGEQHAFISTKNLHIINIGFYSKYWTPQEDILDTLIVKFQNMLTSGNRQIHLSCQVLDKIVEIINWLELELKHDNNDILIHSMFVQLFYLITKTQQSHIYRTETHKTIKDDIFNLLKIYKTSHENIMIKDYTKNNGRTYNTFLRNFVAITGLSPKDVDNKIKLYNSKNIILNNPHMNVSEVAISAGFDDLPYFSKLFKKEFNMSPKQYALTIEKEEIKK